MKRQNKLLLLTLALVLVGGAALAAVKFIPDETVEEAPVYTVCTVDTENLQSLGWSYDGESLSFSREGSAWVYDGDADFPLEQSRISAMLSAISEVTATKVIEGVSELADYGLDEPVCSITADGLCLDIGGESYAVSMEYSEDETAYVYGGDGEGLDFDGLLDLVEALPREGSAQGAQGLEELISLRFAAEGWDEVELTLYSYDSGSCLAVLNGEYYFTERSAAEQLRDSALELLSPED